ncbi:uncharacterized protein MONOS_7074 [Monocercomonoides exilis]|uniref:uncharacterized protein n=1 Tax=Monocercomonoides exilis TaxID=2049356 RepID=UPI0035597483|nr:hypothetical protein MONOS_7074 [Monocercomonoides exilis]|eukprot:MONOS_7074.1-p1 / transcript=MONOS_7074.1 / gene=MONOS_7074 / organism=Monocercomonoides_exilis_PA203 / gene_product=unspecified product / transcript_product=unspecified product / location=Mono_scaffold00234:68286-69218(-) / protein_length=311 / sequence_SO=supercontig / SO=protein_coding / is_pseudo=false
MQRLRCAWKARRLRSSCQISASSTAASEAEVEATASMQLVSSSHSPAIACFPSITTTSSQTSEIVILPQSYSSSSSSSSFSSSSSSSSTSSCFCDTRSTATAASSRFIYRLRSFMSIIHQQKLVALTLSAPLVEESTPASKRFIDCYDGHPTVDARSTNKILNNERIGGGDGGCDSSESGSGQVIRSPVRIFQPPATSLSVSHLTACLMITTTHHPARSCFMCLKCLERHLLQARLVNIQCRTACLSLLIPLATLLIALHHRRMLLLRMSLPLLLVLLLLLPLCIPLLPINLLHLFIRLLFLIVNSKPPQ